jgi:hypothetical protein
MLQQIEEDEGEFDMVPEPSLDKHVFCRVKEDRGAGNDPGLTTLHTHSPRSL